MGAKIKVVEKRTLINTSAFAKAIEKAAEEQVLELLDGVAREAEARADAIVSAEFNNSRAPDRRHAGPHLLGNFVGSVERTPGGRVVGTISLRSRAAGVKVASLNYGSSAHQIGADGRWLKFPPGELGGQYRRSAAYFKKRKATASGSVFVRGPVEHPGTLGSHFLERALEQAVRARLRTPVVIPRR